MDAQADGEYHRHRAEEFLSWADAARKRLEENERQKTSLTATNNDLRLYSDGLRCEVDESKIARDRSLKKAQEATREVRALTGTLERSRMRVDRRVERQVDEISSDTSGAATELG